MSGIYKSAGAAQRVETLYRDLLRGWPAPNEQRTVTTRHGDTFVITSGPPSASVVVLLHGALSNSSAWLFDARSWSVDLRVVAVDIVGEPGLSAPNRLSLPTDAHAEWLDDVFAALGIERAAIVGTSLGGFLALDYAVRRPERVERLALRCPSGIGHQKKDFLLKALPFLFLGEWGAAKVRAMVFGPSPADKPPPEARALFELLALVGKVTRPRMVKVPLLSDAAVRSLPPLLAIVGGRDVMFDSADIRDRLERLAPRAKVLFLPDAYHVIPGHTDVIHDFLRAPQPV